MSGPGPDIDTAALAAYLADALDVEVVGTEVLNDAVNLTVAVETAAEGRSFVLQRPNELRDLETFNDLAVEAAVLERLAPTAVPAPEPVHVCEDEAVLGDPFIVTTHLDGEAVPLGSRLPERYRLPAAREAYAHRLVDTLATFHAVDVAPFAAVCDRRLIGAHVDRIRDQFATAVGDLGEAPLGYRRVADWLAATVPARSDTTLVHGDYRPGNVLVAGADSPAVTGLLDWETAFLGDPLTELGYLLLRWRDAGDPTPDVDAIAARRGDGPVVEELRETNATGLAPFSSEPGSPTRQALVARYEDATGRRVADDRFYRAFAAFTLAAVWTMLAAERDLGDEGAAWLARVEYVLGMAELAIDGEWAL